MLGATVFVVEASGRTCSYEHSKIGELVKSLWPGEQHADGPCRTLRFLGDSAKQDFLLRPTKRGILVRADFARALVEPDRAVFLSARGSFFESFKEELLEHIGGSGRSFTEEYTFSSFVVESIVCATVTMLTLRLQVLKPVAENILGHIRLQSPDSILQLYPVKLALSSFVEQVRPLVQGLNGVLQDPGVEGVAAAGCLPSRPSWSRKISEMESVAGPDQLPVGLEDCLHNWVHSAEEVMADACETNVAIEDTMRFLEASMSCTRNRLLMFEVWTMIATVAMGLGAMISGIFGMNLKSGLEEAPEKFSQVVMLIMVLAFLIITVSVGFIVFSQRKYQANAARFGNNRFFKSIADDEYVLSLCSRPDGSVLPEVQLDHVLRELQCPALPLHGSVSFARGTTPQSQQRE
jgi:magnesium transporter